MRLPDPFTLSLKVCTNACHVYLYFTHPFIAVVEMLPDIAHAPRIVSDYESIIPENLKKVTRLYCCM